MRSDPSLGACETLVRRVDPDRYYANMLAPRTARPLLAALYAFNYEIARVGEYVREPMLGEIRLQWWREAVEQAREGRPKAHDVARALQALFATAELPQEFFDAMIDARRFDCTSDTFANMAALEAYADATSGTLMRLAARVLGAGAKADAAARDAGVGYALTGLLRALPFHAARNKLYLPLDLLGTLGLSPEDIFAGRGGEPLKAAMQQIALGARDHLQRARKEKIARAAFPALLPAALSPLYLRHMTRHWFDPFRDRAELPLARRQWALLAAAARGRL